MRNFYIEDSEDGNAIVFANNQPIGFVQILDPEELKPLIIKKYKEREVDGLDYFENFRADMMLTVMDNTNTIEQVVDLENHMKLLADEIMRGSWITAQDINSGLALSGLYDQTMKDDIQSYIDNYILNNY